MNRSPKTALTDDAAQAQHRMLGLQLEKTTFERTTHPDAQWFGTAGLGLFIHWGLSSVRARGDLSWFMMANTTWDTNRPYNNKVTPNEYYQQAEEFDPREYDPYKWLEPAAKAGFRYAVLTTKHHDGYTLWPSETGEMGTQKYLGGRDLVAPFVQACRDLGLKVGLYFSPPDWWFNRHYMSFNFGSPGNFDCFPDRPDFDMDHQPTTLPPKPEGWEEQYHTYVRTQVIELLTRYAPVDLIWFDGPPAVMSIEELRSYNPGLVVNPRMHGYGDFKTPECSMPEARPDGWWELCQGWPNCGWGYEHPGGESYKSLEWMLTRLTQVRRWGGNYLINVGPRSNGTLADEYYKRMDEFIQAGGLAAVEAGL